MRCEDLNFKYKTKKEGTASLNQTLNICLSYRNKELRLNAIKEMMQTYRHGTAVVDPRPTNVPIDELVKLMNLNNSHPSPMDAYPMKRRSFHPSCKFNKINTSQQTTPVSLTFCIKA
jgi:hypothetical protein